MAYSALKKTKGKIRSGYICQSCTQSALSFTSNDYIIQIKNILTRISNRLRENYVFDFKFERHLNNTTAEYSLNDNGTIRVKNRGYHTIDKEWRESIGKAKFVKDDKTAMLKVSFFGPFYGGYNVLAIDDDYKFALVAGESLKYLWILSRETTLPEDVKENYLNIAQEVGYDTSKLFWIEHNSN